MVPYQTLKLVLETKILRPKLLEITRPKTTGLSNICAKHFMKLARDKMLV